jgi:hypothetical protein
MAEKDLLEAASSPAAKTGATAVGGMLLKMGYDLWKRRAPLRSIKEKVEKLEGSVAQVSADSTENKLTLSTLAAKQVTKDDFIGFMQSQEKVQRETAKYFMDALQAGLTHAHERIDELHSSKAN